jgi:hypothetical protein
MRITANDTEKDVLRAALMTYERRIREAMLRQAPDDPSPMRLRAELTTTRQLLGDVDDVVLL